LNKAREEKAKAEGKATDLDFKYTEIKYELDQVKTEYT
jgi:hypothetical protein